MTLYEALLFLHILGAFLILAGAGLGTGTYVALRQTRSTRLIEVLLRAEGKAPLLTIPGAFIALIFGTWLVDEASYDFDSAWISASYVAWVLAVGLSAGVLGPTERRVRRLAQAELAAGREESPALLAAVRQPKLALVEGLLTALLAIFLYLMTFKPGA